MRLKIETPFYIPYPICSRYRIALATQPLILTRITSQAVCRVPSFSAAVVAPGFSGDCAVGKELGGGKKELCDVMCDTKQGYWPGVGNYHCNEEKVCAFLFSLP